MDSLELSVNIRILEYLGWFIAEAESSEDYQDFDIVLQCCKPDGTAIERVPVTNFLLSVYDEEEGSLDARLWFFATRYSTSLDNLEHLIDTYYDDNSYAAIEYTINRNVSHKGTCYYTADVEILLYDGEVHDFEIEQYGAGGEYSTAAMALATAFMDCVSAK